MSPRTARVMGGGLLLVGLLTAWAGLRATPAEVSPQSFAFLNFDRPGINAHNSPAVATDPARPEVAAMADRIDTPQFSCSVALSDNAGDNWRPLAVPLPAEAPNCYWPDVAYDDRGRLLVLYTSTGGRFNLPVGVWLQPFSGRAPDGPAVRVASTEAFHARLAVRGSAVVVAYVQAGPAVVDQGVGFPPGPNPIMVRRSDDGGATFAAPVAVSEPGRRVALPSVVLGSDEELVVGALDLADDVDDYEGRHGGQGGEPVEGPWRVVSYRSTDGGASFAPASMVADDLVIPQRIIVNLGPRPSFAWDLARNRLYAAWDAGRGDGRDVFVARSDDGGANWSPPGAVVERAGTQQLPTLGVAPDGRLDVVFYDRSDDPFDHLTEVAMSSSWNGGRTFTTSTISRVAFDSRIGFGSSQGIPILGSQLATIARPGGATAFWSDTRRATVDNNAQELGLAQVTVAERGDRRWPVAGVGAALAVAGAVVAVGRRGGKPVTRSDR
ncbi:MAG: sialidase family protein [Acidimicrobiales bacterium]